MVSFSANEEWSHGTRLSVHSDGGQRSLPPSCVQFKKYCLLPVSEVTFISEAAADILNAV